MTYRKNFFVGAIHLIICFCTYNMNKFWDGWKIGSFLFKEYGQLEMKKIAAHCYKSNANNMGQYFKINKLGQSDRNSSTTCFHGSPIYQRIWLRMTKKRRKLSQVRRKWILERSSPRDGAWSDLYYSFLKKCCLLPWPLPGQSVRVSWRCWQCCCWY